MNGNYQKLQQFLTDSPWNHRAVMDQVAKNISARIGDKHNAGFYIDETYFAKKEILLLALVVSEMVALEKEGS